MVERPELIFRDLEAWEEDFLAMQFEHEQACARRYPPELLNLFTASQTVLEGAPDGGASAPAAAAAPGGKAGGKKGAGASPAAAAAGAGAGAGAAGAAAAAAGARARAPAAAAAAPSLTSFYEGGDDGGSRSNATSGASSGLDAAPRASSADAIGDTRSLERAYSQRLILFARRGGGGDAAGGAGTWGLPCAELRGADEPMVAAAERAVRGAFAADGDLELWFPGAAPMGHQLVEYGADAQAASGRLGAKVFFYRAHILGGRLRAQPASPARAYDDWQWLTRDEAEAVLPRPDYKYLHQILGAGAGEEFARRGRWLAAAAARGLSAGQATGRRAHRVDAARAARTRLLAVATRGQAALAAQPWAPAKAAALRAEVDATSARLREQKGVAAAAAAAMRPPTLAALAAAARAAKAAAPKAADSKA